MESGGKRREVIRSEPVSLGGDSEEKGDSICGDPPWGVSGLNHTLGVPALGSATGKMSFLGWLEGQWDQQEGCGDPGHCS